MCRAPPCVAPRARGLERRLASTAEAPAPRTPQSRSIGSSRPLACHAFGKSCPRSRRGPRYAHISPMYYWLMCCGRTQDWDRNNWRARHAPGGGLTSEDSGSCACARQVVNLQSVAHSLVECASSPWPQHCLVTWLGGGKIEVALGARLSAMAFRQADIVSMICWQLCLASSITWLASGGGHRAPGLPQQLHPHLTETHPG